MATVNAVSNLNAAAHVFSPTPKLKLQMDDLKNVNRFDGLEINDYEERILIKKMVKKTESGSGIDRRSYQQFIEYCRFCKNNGEKEEMYLSHVTKESGGKVQCPVLRDYTCPK